MEVAILLFAAIAGAVVRFLDARQDAEWILANRPINHADGLSEQVAIGLVFTGLLTVIAERCGSSWWIIVPIACTYAGAGGIVFRYTLNRLRGLPWDYVSTSNNYDSLFLNLFRKRAGVMEYVFEAFVMIVPAVIYLKT